MASDLILGFFSIIFYLLIFKMNKYWGFFFLFMSLSAISGGFWHGYFDESNNILRFISWLFLSISLLMAAFDLYRDFKVRTFLISITLLLLLLAFFSGNFIYMMIDALVVMLGFVMIKSINKSRENKGYIYVTTGIIFSLISVLFQISRYSFAKNLNYNDIGHYISAISLFIIFLGVKRLTFIVKINKS